MVARKKSQKVKFLKYKLLNQKHERNLKTLQNVKISCRSLSKLLMGKFNNINVYLRNQNIATNQQITNDYLGIRIICKK